MTVAKTKKDLMEELKNCKQMLEDYEAIIYTAYDQFTIADGNGTYLILKQCYELYGLPEPEVLRMSPYDIEKTGLANETVLAKVLKSKKREVITQESSIGKKYMVTGIPVFKKSAIKKVYIVSQNITTEEDLQCKLKKTQDLLEWYQMEARKNQEFENQRIVGNSKEMQKVIDLAATVSHVNATILLKGETGCGKNTLAKAIHNMSNRKEKPFVQVNCGAIPENLIESELFGYVEGAFTGASRKGKKGYFEIANGGTIFLDEIADLPLNLQVKLLHVLENNEIYKVGSEEATSIDTRIIAATNKDISSMVRQGKFREDLYYRLNVLTIHIPPLRGRREDITALANYFLTKYNHKYYKSREISCRGYDVLRSYQWPGNIRELENTIERLVITCDKDVIDEHHIMEVLYEIGCNSTIEVKDIIPLREATQEVERQLLFKAYKQYKSTRKVSEVLKIDQSTVVKKLQKLRNESANKEEW